MNSLFPSSLTWKEPLNVTFQVERTIGVRLLDRRGKYGLLEGGDWEKLNTYAFVQVLQALSCK